MLDQRRRRWADVVKMLYKCLVFAGQADFQTLYIYSMLGQRRRRWPSVETALDQCPVQVVSCNHFSSYINAVNLYSIGYCWPTLDRPRHARLAVESFFKVSCHFLCGSAQWVRYTVTIMVYVGAVSLL